MYCPNCGKPIVEKNRFCPYCGKKKRRSKIMISLLFIATFLSGAFFASSNLLFDKATTEPQKTAYYLEERIIDERNMIISIPTSRLRVMEEAQRRELTEIISDAQKSVYTIYTPFNQGSGFLYNETGAVVTNAHVVEGEPNVQLVAADGSEYDGTVIGYSNETDVAVIHVPDLVGNTPFAKNTTEPVLIGEEVIALGSPLGLENTATIGYVTGTNREFVIDTFVYENLYQISAPISPGSSGGPLLAKNKEQIVAINSAQNIHDSSIGFSIPLYQVDELLQSWIDDPLSQEEILEQYFDNYGDYFFGESWENEEGYFDGGDFSEEEFYEYWEYDYHEFWNEFGEEYWEYFYDEILGRFGEYYE
ncbi:MULTISPECIES: trypsin-like peptidase domain-containing protein [Bacillaceae]|uniref:Trypsin-like peptidase domain-containing protein n=1 Tax=Evansella alkalicola TaxID=745819 RepID=A0ABS6JSF2_9BACI|nr:MULTISPECIES: trypsin-like peptidase domain-containing protein [Bacillaceae]MBU9720090.1 trypsin-like peptidase domain-containing protein [Bacillus alkalicola]